MVQLADISVDDHQGLQLLKGVGKEACPQTPLLMYAYANQTPPLKVLATGLYTCKNQSLEVSKYVNSVLVTVTCNKLDPRG